MKKNLSSPDRIIRILLAMTFIVLFVTHTIIGILGVVLIVAAIVFLATALIGWCPLYAIFGVHTRHGKEQP